VIELGHDPKDVKATEKQLKIPQLHHPQTKEVLEAQQGHEELMELVLKLNGQLKETEKELDTLIQSKQSDLATTSRTIIPTVSTMVPSTLVASLAPTAPPTIALPVTAEYSATTCTQGEKAAELVKAMEEMSIQATKMKRLKEKVASLETDCKLAQL